MSALLFDLGGTFLRAGVANGAGTVENITRLRIRSVADGAPFDLIWDQVLASMFAYEAAQRAVVAPEAPIVISFPGPISGGSRPLQAPTVSGGSHALCDFAGIIERVTGRRTIMLNDVSAAAWRLAELSEHS